MKKIPYILNLVLVLLIGVFGTLYFMNREEEPKQVVEEEKKVTFLETDSINESIEIVYDSVVLVENIINNKVAGTGTGFVYKTDDEFGYILTNYHVVKNNQDVQVLFANDTAVKAEYLGGDEVSDIAVLKVEKEAVISVAKIGDSRDSLIGDIVFTVGSPLGREYLGTVTKGILSGKDRFVEVSLSNGDFLMNVLQTDAAINPGNSGGPLVNLEGEVVGINSLKIVQNTIEGMGFAIPIEVAMSNIELLEQGKEIKRPYLGVQLVDASNNYLLLLNRIYLDKDITEGMVIVTIEEGKTADNAGLLEEDVITHINGEKIASLAQFRFELFKHQIGDTIEFTIIRDEESKKINVEL